MMYTHHDLEVGFTGNNSENFRFATEVNVVLLLSLVNDMFHGLYLKMPMVCLPFEFLSQLWNRI